MAKRWISLGVGLLAVVGCAKSVERAPEPVTAADVSAGDERSSGCGFMQGPGEPVAMDYVHPKLGISAQHAAQYIAGRHEVSNVWLPWWSAAPIAGGPLERMTLDIAPGAAYATAEALQIAARLTLSDGQGAIIVSGDTIFDVSTQQHAFASLDFEEATLASRLGLPPATDRTRVADPFNLAVLWSGSAFEVYLDSKRAGTSCRLSQPPQRPATCEPGAGSLVMHEGALTEARALDAKLVGSFAPIDAIEELRKQALEITWPDGSGPSQLHVTYEPDGHACVTQGEIYVRTSPDDVVKAQGYKVLIPLSASLRSDDGRLLVRLRGAAETRVASSLLPWDRYVEGALGSLQLAQLAPEERPGFVVPAGAYAFLFATLHAPLDDTPMPQLSLTVCNPYPGVPAYPPVQEDFSNRRACFCVDSSQHEAPIRLAGSGSP